MRILDPKGRLLGVLNVIDLAIAALVCVVATLGYHALARHDRIVVPHPLAGDAVWARTELRIPPGNEFLRSAFRPGAHQLDPRYGTPVAELLDCAEAPEGGLTVTVRLLAARDANGGFFYDGRRLVPGRGLCIETETCIVDGVVAAPPAAVAAP